MVIALNSVATVRYLVVGSDRYTGEYAQAVVRANNRADAIAQVKRDVPELLVGGIVAIGEVRQ